MKDGDLLSPRDDFCSIVIYQFVASQGDIPKEI